MNALGRHILAEFYGCLQILMIYRGLSEQWSTALEAGAEVRKWLS